jgi:hypothetical protein
MWLSGGYYTVAGYLNAHCDSVHTRPLYLGVEGYEDPSTRAFSSCQPAFGDPVVDGGTTDFQLAGEFSYAQFTIAAQLGGRYFVSRAYISDRVPVKGPSYTGGIAGVIEYLSQLGIGVRRAKVADHSNYSRIASALLAYPGKARDDDLVRRSTVPADSDAGLGQIRLYQQGDI